jgi:hypothetical protein
MDCGNILKETFTVKKQYKFPSGISPSYQHTINEYWIKTRSVDLTKPQYEMYSIKEQAAEQKAKAKLDAKTIDESKDYFGVRDKLRASGYTDDIATGNWKRIIETAKRYKHTKVTFADGYYTLWRK